MATALRKKLIVKRSDKDTMWIVKDIMGKIYKIFYHKDKADKWVKEKEENDTIY